MLYEEFDSPRAYDLRQLRRMQNLLRSHLTERGSLVSTKELREMIDGLTFLKNNLQQMPHDWLQRFHREWAVLEDVYSWMVVCNSSQWTQESREAVQNAVQALCEMVEDAIKQLEPIVLEEELRFYSVDK
ncbi:MAG: hypothetical protein KatS3mg022_2031 [Armatimonadota bacterium]|nr:MAG: hypothetical protein KatS3mg022_2031 [Armatimonadota bacterium]